MLLGRVTGQLAALGRGDVSGRKEDGMVDLSRAMWRKSTQSNANGCVEVAFVDMHVAVRDSKNQGGSVLVFTPAEWQAFIDGVREREFELSARK